MLTLRNTRVISFSLDYLDVFWEIEPTNEDIQEYEFYVERSESEGGPWDKIAGPMIDTYSLRDTSVLLMSNNRLYFYRIRVRNARSGDEVYSKPFDREGSPDLYGEEIMRMWRVLLEQWVGVKCWLFPRKTFGQRCSSCYDDVLQRVLNDECPVCWRTSFIGGYLQPIEFLAQIDEPEKTEHVTVEDHRQVEVVALRAMAHPEVKPLDLIIDHKNRRMRVVSVNSTRRLGVPIHQEIRLVRIEVGSIEDAIPLKVDNATITLVPSNTFTNIQSDATSQEEALSNALSLYRF